MAKYIWCDQEMTFVPVERFIRAPSTMASDFPSPMIQSDIPAYKSPLGDGAVIEGRAARREHLARNGCREVDPSEYRPAYRSEKWAKRMGHKEATAEPRKVAKND